ncbi:hypothetical protein [Microbacterium lacticum]
MTAAFVAPRIIAVAAAVILGAALVACTPTAAPSTPTPTNTESTVHAFQPVYDAVAASDPRVERVSSVSVSQSGAVRQLTVVIRVTGDEPVTTDTLVAVLTAIRDSAGGSADMLQLIARDADDPDRLLDLEPAIAGLPSGVSALRIDGALVVPFDDLNQLGG